MALTKCRECGEQVSNKAGTCPKCGCPTKGKNKSAMRLLFFLILSALGFLIYSGIRPELESAHERVAQERQQLERDRAAEGAAREVERDEKWEAEALKQPERQQFIQENMGTFGIRKIESRQNGATLWVADYNWGNRIAGLSSGPSSYPDLCAKGLYSDNEDS